MGSLAINDRTVNEGEKLYYLAYGAELHPKLLAARLKGKKPLSSHTVRIDSAFLSFDIRGVPYLEPCFTSAIVQGVNDGDWKDVAKEEKERDQAYRLWIWQRCCPGLEFTGELPPRLEGVAYELSSSHWAEVMHESTEQPRPSSSTAATSYRVIKVEGMCFSHGDPTKPLGTLVAHMPLGDSRLRAAGLQPTLKYLRLVLLGAFFSTCSQPYLANLTLLRPYQPKTLLKTATSYLFTLFLLPPFLFVHLPTALARKVFGQSFGWGRLGRWTERRSWSFLRGAERVLRGVMGSGYYNEGEGGAHVVSRKEKRE